MKIKPLVAWLLALTLLCGLSPTLASAAPGSQQDPLISKSYIDGTFKPQVMAEPLDMLRSSMVVLRYKLQQASGGSSSSSGVASIKGGQSIALPSGSGFTLLSGSSTLTSLSGTLLDLTDGSAVAVGQSLKSGHRYLAAEKSSAVAGFSASSKIKLTGSASISDESGLPSFADVPENAWYWQYVYYAVEKGLVNGKSEVSFAPDSDISYAETIKLAACMHQLFQTGSISLKNSDAPAKWYQSYVSYAMTNGIISSGYSDYDAKISRGEFVSIFYSSMPATNYKQINTVGDNKIPDLKITDKYANQVYAFYRAGILIGSDGLGNFFSDSSIKRSEVAAVMTRMYEVDSRKSITL